ncbi:hypothetical protein [Piscirickettsia litoralis]|uniref:Phage virion morphogenesis protein n=1 Tax=Piscirickettsia litoralis TaxID=1891921 RepID=A0ABX2ZXR8_9GAMM|nr:hypothetical protein [Piscirickettsia litoralis]ODN41169.1 hypothetical protein BGC07_18010 [Piscirickettsia litoralis]
MAELTLELRQLEQLRDDFAATEQQYNQALLYTIKDLNRWLTSQVIKEVKKKYPLKLKEIKRRLFGRAKVFNHEAVSWLWLGVRGMNANIFGRAVQTQQGVYLPSIKKLIPGAFIANGKIWQRKSRSRMPIMTPTVELDFDGLLDKYSVLAEKKFYHILDDKLRSTTQR